MRAVESLEICTFDVILFSKAFKDFDGKAQKSYASWHWEVMESLKKSDSWFQKGHEVFDEF